jgi:hypothetical protein
MSDSREAFEMIRKMAWEGVKALDHATASNVLVQVHNRARELAESAQTGVVVLKWFSPFKKLPTHSKPVIGFHSGWIDAVNKEGLRECFTTSDGGVWLSAFWPEGADRYETAEMMPMLWTDMATPPKHEQDDLN